MDRSASPAGEAGPAHSRDEGNVRAALVGAGPGVRRYLFGLCGRWDQAEDLAQDALLKAWRARHRFDGRASVTTWLFRIARNHWLDQVRRQRVRPQEQAMPQALLDNSRTDRPADAAARGELAEALARALATLPDDQREALALRESRQLTFPQMAQVLGVPVATAKSRVRYALLTLARDLRAFAPEPTS